MIFLRCRSLLVTFFLVTFFSLSLLSSLSLLWIMAELTVPLFFALVCVDMELFSTCILYTSPDLYFAATLLT